ncbi:hypothetical protein G9A89_001617 [Geosiphon pyriformis]|nr:hypothetical protein G9A89_001617 [Geosiphon pyriformis]
MHDYLAGLEDSPLRVLNYDAFRKLWHQLTLHIQIMSPRTDLCDTCQNLQNDLQFKAYHLAKAKLEKNYYNKNTKLAEQRKLVNQHSPTHVKAQYRSVDATVYYSYDWAQNVHVPHSDQQIGKVYYLSARKMHLFGIQDEVFREQINDVVDKNELLGKGSNEEEDNPEEDTPLPASKEDGLDYKKLYSDLLTEVENLNQKRRNSNFTKRKLLILPL